MNRINGDFSREFKTFSSETGELVYENHMKGKCTKSNLKSLF